MAARNTHPAPRYVTRRTRSDLANESTPVLVGKMELAIERPHMVFSFGTWRASKKRRPHPGKVGNP